METDSAVPDARTKFLSLLDKFIEDNLGNTAMHAVDVSTFMNVSKSTLNRKLKRYGCASINLYIHEMRLKKAWSLLSLDYSVSDVSSIVGYKRRSYFSQVFKVRFRSTPSSVKR
jgi:AraC-like DNA-binding protein